MTPAVPSLPLGPDPDSWRARRITTYEGTYIHVGDFKAALDDDAFIESWAAVLKAGIDRGDSPLQALRAAIGNAVYVLSGAVDREKREEK